LWLWISCLVAGGWGKKKRGWQPLVLQYCNSKERRMFQLVNTRDQHNHASRVFLIVRLRSQLFNHDKVMHSMLRLSYSCLKNSSIVGSFWPAMRIKCLRWSSGRLINVAMYWLVLVDQLFEQMPS
jgi:hypothetical protein